MLAKLSVSAAQTGSKGNAQDSGLMKSLLVLSLLAGGSNAFHRLGDTMTYSRRLNVVGSNPGPKGDRNLGKTSSTESNPDEIVALIDNLSSRKIAPEEFESKVKSTEAQVLKKRAQEEQELMRQEQELIVFTAIGGLILGFAGGGVLDVNLIGTDIPLLVAPITLGAVSAGGLYYITSQGDVSTRKIATAYVGKPTMKVRDSLVESANEAIDDVNKGIQSQVDETKSRIQNFPNFVKDLLLATIDNAVLATKNKVENIKQDILKSPEYALDAAQNLLRSIKEDLNRKIDNTVHTI